MMGEWWHLQVSNDDIHNEMVMTFTIEWWWYLQWAITDEMMMVFIMKYWWYLQMECEVMIYVQNEFLKFIPLPQVVSMIP